MAVQSAAIRQAVVFGRNWMSVRGVIAALAVLVWMSAGCARQQEPPRIDASAAHGTDDAFDVSAGKPPTADTMYGLARILMAQGRVAESVALLRNTVGQYPNYLPAYNALAEAHLWLGQADDAIEVLRQGLARNPRDPVLLNNLGMALFLEQRYEEALQQFERAAALRPEDSMYRANQAAALGMLGRSHEARALYRQILPPADVGANIQILERARRSGGSGRLVPEEPENDMEVERRG